MTGPDDTALEAAFQDGYREGVTDTVTDAARGRGPAGQAGLRWAAQQLERLPGREAHTGCVLWLQYLADQAVPE